MFAYGPRGVAVSSHELKRQGAADVRADSAAKRRALIAREVEAWRDRREAVHEAFLQRQRASAAREAVHRENRAAAAQGRAELMDLQVALAEQQHAVAKVGEARRQAASDQEVLRSRVDEARRDAALLARLADCAHRQEQQAATTEAQALLVDRERQAAAIHRSAGPHAMRAPAHDHATGSAALAPPGASAGESADEYTVREFVVNSELIEARRQRGRQAEQTHLLRRRGGSPVSRPHAAARAAECVVATGCSSHPSSAARRRPGASDREFRAAEAHQARLARAQAPAVSRSDLLGLGPVRRRNDGAGSAAPASEEGKQRGGEGSPARRGVCLVSQLLTAMGCCLMASGKRGQTGGRSG